MKKFIILIVVGIMFVGMLSGCGPKKYPYDDKVGTGILTVYKTDPVDDSGYVKDDWKSGESFQLKAGTEYTAVFSEIGKKIVGEYPYGVPVNQEFEYITSDVGSGYIQIK